jgi:hypothetical protein
MLRNVRFMLALLVLTLLMGSSAAYALPAEGRNADRGPGVLAAAWEWVVSLVEGKVPFLHATGKTGITIPHPPPTNGGSSGTEGGGSMDPNG